MMMMMMMILFSCHRSFLTGTSLEPTVIPTTQASSVRLLYFPYYVWCSNHSCLFVVNLLNILPGRSFKFFFTPFVAIPVATIITGIITQFRFCIHLISIHKILYFSIFSTSLCTTFLSAGIATSISIHVFSFVFLIIISGLFAVTSLPVCTAWFHNAVTSSCSYNGLCVCVCVPFVWCFNA